MNAPVHFDPAADAYAMPLDQIDVSDPKLYQNDVYHPYFERLRREDPVHYRKDGLYGSFWSVTKFKDIMSVETHPEIYSSEAKRGGITITDRPMQYRRSSFISMDPPRHDEQDPRKSRDALTGRFPRRGQPASIACTMTASARRSLQCPKRACTMSSSSAGASPG